MASDEFAYLFDLSYSISNSKKDFATELAPMVGDRFAELCEELDVEATGFKSPDGMLVGASIRFKARALSGNPFFISEFPGNCGILILSDFQDTFAYLLKYKAKRQKFMEFVKELAGRLNYVTIMATTTHPRVEKSLVEEFGFVVLSEFLNRHSENSNAILSLEIEPADYDEPDDEEEDDDDDEW